MLAFLWKEYESACNILLTFVRNMTLDIDLFVTNACERISWHFVYVLYMHTNSCWSVTNKVLLLVINILFNHDIKCADENNGRKGKWLEKIIVHVENCGR